MAVRVVRAEGELAEGEVPEGEVPEGEVPEEWAADGDTAGVEPVERKSW